MYIAADNAIDLHSFSYIRCEGRYVPEYFALITCSDVDLFTRDLQMDHLIGYDYFQKCTYDTQRSR